MIDILTVVFDEEIDILRVQAQSIDLYCDKLPIKNIWVIVNDRENVCAKIDPSWWGQFASAVQVIHRSRFGTDFHHNGWISQQYLKLKACTVSDSAWVMVIDAKSIFINAISSSNIFDMFGKVKSSYFEPPTLWHKALHNVDAFFNIKLNKFSGIVPYFFEVDLVKQMINHIETQTNQPFDKWFQSFGEDGISEIILYSAYVKYRYGNLWRYYAWSYVDGIKYSLLGSTENNNANAVFVGEFLNGWPGSHMVMIHRKCWTSLCDDNKNMYRCLLDQRGLTTAKML
jgi:hypothetical protein